MQSKIYVLLGSLGDVISVLPILHTEFKNGQRCSLMVAKRYASVMDGVGYADSIVFNGEAYEIDRAVASAWQLSSSVRTIQVAGPPELVKQHSYGPVGQTVAVTDSFVKESYKLSGHFPLWKTQPPLIFDRRDKARETELLKGFPPKKKVILVAADGYSSPFPYRDLLFKMLELNFQPKYVVVDMARFKAERIYDLLGLYERAHCLVASDSAPLHLAQACPDLPVVALANDRPSLWHGAPWRANHICYIRYKDFAARAVEMLDAIEGIGSFGTMKAVSAKGRRLIHAWSQYDISDHNIERHKAACWSWKETYENGGNWVACRIDLRAIGKDSKTIFKEDRPFPGLKEVVRLASFRARENDVIVLTRADTCFDLTDKLDALPVFARRTLRDESGDTWHPTPDLFAFSKAWWDEHGKELPDFVMGMDPHWPRCLMELIKENGGIELPMGTAHKGKGKPNVQMFAHAYSIHNENAAKIWLEKNGGLALFPKVSEQIETIQINPKAIYPGGYNPSIIRHNGNLLMAYRYHHNKDLSTQLAMAELDDKFNVVRNGIIKIEGKHQRSAEDPRLFLYQGQLHISWVDADFPSPAPTCVVKYGRLTQISSLWNIEDIQQPKCGKNDGSALEKNFVFWDSDGALAFLYGIKKEKQLVYTVGTVNQQVPYESPAPRWPWGEIRGGTTPLPYEGKLLRFFHSALDFELAPFHRRYFMGAAIMEPEPPFATIAVSREPVVIGSCLDDMAEDERSQCVPHKGKVVFPAGAIIDGDGWLVSVGLNDGESALLRVTQKDLKL